MHTIFHSLLKFNKFTLVLKNDHRKPGSINHLIESTKKVMRYLLGTKNYMLMYRQTDYLEVIGYSDSDFAGYVDSRRSTSGYIFMLFGGAVS